MDLKRIKEIFNETYSPEYTGRIAVTDMLSKKDRLILNMPAALSNCHWLMFSDFVPENLKKQAVKLADAAGDSDRYADQIPHNLALAKEGAGEAIIAGYAEFEGKPIALLLTSAGTFLAVNAKWLAFFKKAGADTLLINRKSCLCLSTNGKTVGIIMGINLKLEED